MSMSALVRALGAAAGGVSAGMDAAEAAADRKRKRDEDAEDRKYLMSERTRALNMRDQLGRAAAEVAPVEVKQGRPDSMDDRDVGQAGEAPLPTAGYDVAGKRFASMAEASAAAKEQNTPQAVTARMSDVLMRNGDPIGAQRLRAGAAQEQVANFQLSEAQRKHIRDEFNSAVESDVTDWDSMNEFIKKSTGGKSTLVPSADGKSYVLNKVLPDGALQPTEMAYPAVPDGFATAKAGLARLPVETMLPVLHQRAMLAQQAQRDADKKAHDDARLKIDQQKADTEEKYRKDQAAALLAKSAPGAAPIWDDKADAFLRERYTSKHPETGTSTVDGDGLVFAKQIALAAARDKFGGDTTSALGQAFDIDSKLVAESNGDPKVLRELRAKALKALNSGPTTTRPASKAETITEDVQASKPKGYLVDINGRRAAYGTANMADFAGSAVGVNPAPAAAGAPTMSSRVTAAAPAAADPPEGKALDAATAARAAAEQELRKWGQVQRTRDPQGYAAAVAQRDAAVQKEAEARRAWQALVAQDAPAFVRMQAVTAKR